MIYDLPKTLEVNGTEYEIRSDFREILDIIEILNDEELKDSERAFVTLLFFYPDFENLPPECYQEALEQCFWFINGGRFDDESQGNPPRMMDWQQDFPYIIAPVNRVIGHEVRADAYLHWWTFLSAYMEIGESNDALKNGFVKLNVDGNEMELPISDMWDAMVEEGAITDSFAFLQYAMVARADNLEVAVMGLTFPKAGIYFLHADLGGQIGYVSELGTTEEVQTIDPKFLPAFDPETISHLLIGVKGQGENAEVFNDIENNTASGDYSHAEGYDTHAIGRYSHAEGVGAFAYGDYSHAEGGLTGIEFNEVLSGGAGVNVYTSSGLTAKVGWVLCYNGEYATITHIAHDSETGIYTVTLNKTLSREFVLTDASVKAYPHAASGEYSHTEGSHTVASGYCSHAEGYNTNATGGYSHAAGYSTNASALSSHTEGDQTTASGQGSHAEGCFTNATGRYAHAEGNETYADGTYSHAEGQSTHATGQVSHAEGFNTYAEGEWSHAEGEYTIAAGRASHVQGKFNLEDKQNKYAFIIGNGTNTGSGRSNAHTVDWNGNGWYKGDIYVGGTSQDNGEKLAKISEVTQMIEDYLSAIPNAAEVAY